MKIGLTNGVFDLFHMGHRHLLRTAAAHCSILIVAVNDDASVRELKGNDRPFDPLSARMANVRDYGWQLNDVVARRTALFQVIPFNGDAYTLAQVLRPDIIFRGHDQRLDQPNSFIGLVMGVDLIPGISTSSLALQRSVRL